MNRIDMREIVPPVVIKCWQLVQYVLNRWHVLIQFHLEPGIAGIEILDRPEKNRPMKSRVVWFFIPEDAPNRYEITKFLDRECGVMRQEKPAPITVNGETTQPWDKQVHIHSVLYETELMPPYLTQAQFHAINSAMFRQIIAKHDREHGQGSLMNALAASQENSQEKHDPEDDNHILWGLGPEDFDRYLKDQEERDKK